MQLKNTSKTEVFEQTLYHSVCCSERKCFCTYIDKPMFAKPVRQELSFRIPPRATVKVPDVAINLQRVQDALKGPRPWLIDVDAVNEIERLS